MRFTFPIFLLAIAGPLKFVAAQNTATSTADVLAAAATALTRSPTSHVKGKAFDRIAIFFLENTDSTEADADPNLQALQKQGIKLTNYNAVTHPSEPNYIAASGGDYFGLNNDNFERIPSNVSTLVDLLEDKGISWAAYQEDLPYSGFEGFSWADPTKKKIYYVRKHNPFVIYDSIANNKDRLAVIKNFTMFEADLKNNRLPQYMFFTPNMLHDGHDTNVTYAGMWARSFIEPLLKNKAFMENTLILLTFDENETYLDRNTIFTILLGDAIPQKLRGTTDNNYYNHYSEISTIEANWDLHTLGRWDVGANVFSFVAEKSYKDCDTPRPWTGPPPFSAMYFNLSYPGPLNFMKNNTPWPAPYVHATKCGRTVLPQIVKTWGSDKEKDLYYSTGVEIADGLHPPVYRFQ